MSAAPFPPRVAEEPEEVVAARAWIGAVAGPLAAREAEVFAATGPWGQPGARYRVDLALVAPERREAARRALAAGPLAQEAEP